MCGLVSPDLALSSFKKASVSLREVLRQQRHTHPRMCWEVCHQIASVLKDVHDRGYTMGTLDVASIKIMCSDGDMANTVCMALKLNL